MKLQKKTTILFSLFTAIFSLFYLASFRASSAAEVNDDANFGTITPVINELQQITSSDGNGGEQFGYSAAIDGDTAVIGSRLGNGGNGAAYVFIRNGDIWTEQARLTASDAALSDHFGASVAIHGDTIAVGASGIGSEAGGAYVFVRNGTIWTEEAELSQGNVISQLIGVSIAVWGDTVIVGGPNKGIGPFRNVGRAYIYKRTGTAWSLEQQIAASDGTFGDFFGSSVGIEGNTAVIGARGARGVTGAEGAVYVFTRAGTVWSEQTRINANDSARFKNFAYSLSFSGNTIAVGAYSDTEMSINSGSVYIFTGSGANWSQQTKLISSDRASLDSFGWSVSLKGDSLAVGARAADTSTTNSGAGYIFKRTGTSWTEEQKLLASTKNEFGNDALGFSIAHNGRFVVGGAIGTNVAVFSEAVKSPNQNIAGNGQGSVYIFDLLSGLSCQPVQPDLVSWWTGDGNTLDVRSRNDGTLQNGATYGTGKVGQGFNFASGTQQVLVPDNSVWDFGTGDFTIDTWVNFNSVQIPNVFVGHSNAAGNQNKWIFWQNSGQLQFHINSPTLGPTNIGTGVFIPNISQWYHVAVTKTGTTYRFYLDGVEIDSVVDTNPIPNANVNLTIGRAEAINAINGQIDELQIFNRALSTSEIQAIFNADGLGKCKPTAAVKPSGLVGWWAGDGDAKDVGGNENGTLQNGAGFAVNKVGQGFKFDGIDDHVSIPDSPAVSVSTAITIEAWVKPSSFTQRGAILTKYNSDVLDLSYSIEVKAGGAIRFFLDQNGNATVTRGGDTTATIPLNVYSHIAGTFDTATQEMKVYINGAEVALIFTSADNISSIHDGVAPVRIGAINFASPPPIEALFDGEIDEVALYDRALTTTEIKSIFDTGLAGKLKSVNTSAAPFSEFAEKFGKSKGETNIGSSVVSQVGDATITFNSVTADGTTQQISIDINDMPTLPMGIATGLQYDIATSAGYTGNVDICFNLPAFTSSTDFTSLRVLHLENNVWENRTTTSDFSTRTLCSQVTSLSPFAIVQLAPTAANVTISGKALTSNGRGISRAIISVIDQSGNRRTATSNHFGNYKFENIQAGETYTFIINSKRYRFVPQVVNVSESISNLNFIAN